MTAVTPEAAPTTAARGPERPASEDSASPVSEQQRQYFDAYGYLVLKGLFADDIDELAAAFDEVFDDPDQPKLDINVIGHRWRSRFAIGEFVELSPRLSELITDPRLVGAARGLLGDGATYSCSDGAVYHCETEWHYDSPTEDIDRTHVKFAFYLEPLGGDSGAPRVLPGSHLLNRAYRGGPLERYLGFEGETERRTGFAAEDLPHWPLCTDPGDVVVWDFRLLHSSFGRTEPRRKFALNYCSGPEAPAVEHAYFRQCAEWADAVAAEEAEAEAAEARLSAPKGPTPARRDDAATSAARWGRRVGRVVGRTARKVRRPS